jgi:hypothetical protein
MLLNIFSSGGLHQKTRLRIILIESHSWFKGVVFLIKRYRRNNIQSGSDNRTPNIQKISISGKSRYPENLDIRTKIRPNIELNRKYFFIITQPLTRYPVQIWNFGRPDIKNPGVVKKFNLIPGFVRISALDCIYIF